MKNKACYIISAVIVTVMLVSCSKEVPENTAASDKITSEDNNLYRISLEDALHSLDEFIGETETRTSIETDKRISNVLYINRNYYSANTKSDEGAQCLLYVVNFEQEQGYAVLSADSRLPVGIYAVTDAGNAEEQDFYESNQEEFNVLNLIYQSASGNIPVVDTTVKDPVIDPILPPGGDQEPPEGEWVITRWGPWYTTKDIPVMLRTKWHQGEPFNNYVQPNAAGCTSIALFQIMAYNQYPNKHTINGVDIPYSALRDEVYIDSSSSYAEPVAMFVLNFHDKYMDLHFDGETLIFPTAAKKYLESVGYLNVELYKSSNTCDVNRIKESLNKGLPVMVSALANGLNGHSWVVDGIKEQSRSGKKVGEKTGKVYGSKSESRTFLHCNWGWQGVNDGYFYAGVFDSNNPISVPNSINPASESDGYYRHYYRIITYDLP